MDGGKLERRMRSLSVLVRASAVAFVASIVAGCGVHATPMAGSIGTPSKGALTHGATLEPNDGLKWLRQNERHWGLPRFTASIQRAAASVSAQRPGSALYVGDISAPLGGPISGHRSHRSGVDADLLLYLITLDGAPVHSPGFISVDADGLAWDFARGRYVRFDVEREWLLIRALLTDASARVQWIFVSEVLEALILEWARARGDDPEIIWRAQQVMLLSGGPHDDHIHVRTACTRDEIAAGCTTIGPERSWLRERPVDAVDRDVDLVAAILRPFDAPLTLSANP